jgi:hypothetical protein
VAALRDFLIELARAAADAIAAFGVLLSTIT